MESYERKASPENIHLAEELKALVTKIGNEEGDENFRLSVIEEICAYLRKDMLQNA